MLYILPPLLLYFITAGLYLLISLNYFTHPSTLLFSGNDLSSVSMILFLFCYIGHFFFIFRFNIYMKSYGMSLYLSDLLYLA